MGLKVAELETLFTANTDPFEKGAVKVETRRKDLGNKPAEVKVDADAKGALAAMDRVEAAKKSVSKDVVAKLDADVSKAQQNVGKISGELDVLRRMDASPQVTADISKAEASLKTAQSRLKALEGMRAEVSVDADTKGADSKLNALASSLGALAGSAIAHKIVPQVDTSEAGGKVKELGSKISEIGNTSGADLSGGIVGALAAIPFAGAVVGLGAAIIKTITSGMQNEVRGDRLAAATGLDPVTVGRLGRAAGEAYASNWGESIAANFDTAKTAVQTRLLDPTSTARDAQQVIESLSGVSDIIGEEIPRVARSTAQLLRTGLAKDAAGAFDIIVKGQQAGLNVSEDWLDTIDEYSTQWRKLGLTGDQVLGLLSQGIRAGARDTDIAADALKEFSIRAVDGSKTTAAGFKQIGLDADDMAEKIGKGGPTAAAALELTLDKLRQVQDPAQRAQAAVALFGTQAEDMGQALYSMDLSTAVQQLGNVQGAAKSALDTLTGNAANDVETAKRNIVVAADGIKGALATAFAPQIEAWAASVTNNREGLTQFLLDLANGGLNVGRSIVEGIANGTVAVGEFVSGPLADIVESAGEVALAIDKMLPGDQHGQATKDSLKGMADDMRTFKDTTSAAADELRTNLITNGLDPAQKKLNDIGAPLLQQAALHDSLTRLTGDVDALGTAADGSTVRFDGLDLAHLRVTESGRLLDDQLTNIVADMGRQITLAQASGQSQDEVQAKYLATRDALLQQMTAMGLTQAQAEALIAQYGLTPNLVGTRFEANTDQAYAATGAIKAAYESIPPAKTTNIYADTSNASARLADLQAQLRALGDKTIRIATGGGGTGGQVVGNATGHILQPMALGGLDPTAQMVPPGTLRVVGDRLDVDEAYIPLDGSPRSLAILAETIRRMPGVGMRDGGLSSGRSAPAGVVTALFSDAQVAILAAAVRDGTRAELGAAARSIRAGVR